MREQWLKAGMAAVVTGGTSGIGRSVAEALAAEGVRVAAFSRTAAEAGAGKGILPIACDVRSRVSVDEAMAQAITAYGRLDILVNAAGVSMPEFLDISRIEPDLWNRVIETNLTGLFLVTRAAMPHLKAGGGYILNILSTAAFRSIEGNAPYSASKYGARAVSETAAIEGKGSGIRVASISPGPVNTNIWSHKTTPPDAEKRARMLDPQDIADIALFLLKSPGYVSIENVTVAPFNF
jgi:NAD(P)-dependent dehydrogenase (short-subunit alcohol dehydrogenase family)